MTDSAYCVDPARSDAGAGTTYRGTAATAAPQSPKGVLETLDWKPSERGSRTTPVHRAEAFGPVVVLSMARDPSRCVQDADGSSAAAPLELLEDIWTRDCRL